MLRGTTRYDCKCDSAGGAGANLSAGPFLEIETPVLQVLVDTGDSAGVGSLGRFGIDTPALFWTLRLCKSAPLYGVLGESQVSFSKVTDPLVK